MKEQIDLHWHLTRDNIIITYEGKPRQFSVESEIGEKILELIKTDKISEILNIIDKKKLISDKSKNFFYVESGEIFSYGERVHPFIEKKIFTYIEKNIPFDYLIKFWNNLLKNPSAHVREHLPLFLEANDYTITQDGSFIAYKRVRSDFRDHYTGKMDNSPGKVVKLKRSEVDGDPNRDCSYGLHIAPFYYAKDHYMSGQGTLIEILVDPFHVVAIPYNYHAEKARVCQYVVLKEVHEKPEFEEVKNIEVIPVSNYVIKDGKIVIQNSPFVKIKENCAINGLVNMEIETTDTVKDHIKIGNYKYDILELNGASVPLYAKRIKPSDRPKAITSKWGLSIKNVYKYKTKNASVYDYYVEHNDNNVYSIVFCLK